MYHGSLVREPRNSSQFSLSPPPRQLGTSALLCSLVQLAWAEHGEEDPDMFPGLQLLVYILPCLHYIAQCNSGSYLEQLFSFI